MLTARRGRAAVGGPRRDGCRSATDTRGRRAPATRGRRILRRVWTPLVVLAAALCLVLATWAAWRTAVDRPVILRQLLAAAVIEALLVVQVVVALVSVAAGTGPADAVTFWGYLVTTLLVLPFAAAWAFAERTRWSSVVLLVAAVTVAFLQYRTVQVWTGA